MAIYQRGTSYYYDFVYKGQRYTGNIGPVSRSVAKEEEIKKKHAVIEGILNPAKARKSPRFAAFVPEYLDWVKANKKPLTYEKAISVMKRLTVSFGLKRLNEISAWEMERYKKARKDAGYAPATINQELAFLKALLNKAVAWKKLADHPGREVKGLTVANERTRFLSEEEEARLLAVCRPGLRRIIEAGLLTGCRPRELTSLRPHDIDLDRGLVHVASCFAKNGESRVIPIGQRLKGVLTDALAEHGPTVFLTMHGVPWEPGKFSMVFRGACHRAGMTPCGPHTLRHTFASRLVMAGVDIRTVQELMGHKDINMTLRYTHLSPDHKRGAIAALEARFSGQQSQQFSQQSPQSPMQTSTKVVTLRKVSNS